jgi:hypothetical protein
MASRHPKVQVHIARGSVDLLVEALRRESVDVILVDQRALSAPTTRRRAGSPAARRLPVPGGPPAARRASVDIDQLRKHPVASAPSRDRRLLVDQLGPDAHPAPRHGAAGHPSLLDLVEATDTVFFGIFACASARIAAGGL